MYISWKAESLNTQMNVAKKESKTNLSGKISCLMSAVVNELRMISFHSATNVVLQQIRIPIAQMKPVIYCLSNAMHAK